MVDKVFMFDCLHDPLRRISTTQNEIPKKVLEKEASKDNGH